MNRPGIEAPIPGLFSFCKFLRQPDANLHTVDEAVAFVVAAESADWIYDLIHLPERHAIHQLIQFMEILLGELKMINIGSDNTIKNSNIGAGEV